MTQTLGEKLKARRIELGLSMREAAERYNVKKSFIHRIENGHATNANFKDMCTVLVKYGFGERDIYQIAFDIRNEDA